jgi:hypothetical protein
MHIRAIRPDEIDRFAAFHPDENAAAQTRAYLARQLDAGHTRLAWCFVAEEGEQFLGRVAFWGLAGAMLPDAIALLELPWSEDAVAVGERLFDATLPPLAAQGVPHLDYSLREPSPWHRFPDRQRPVLAQLGFRLMREAKRYDRIAPIVG